MNRINHPFSKKGLFQLLELFAVLLIGFGIFIYSSTISLLEQNGSSSTTQNFSSFDFYFIILYELIALSLIVLILKKRKWKIHDFNLGFQGNMIFIALLLVVLRFIGGYIFNYVLLRANFFGSEAFISPEINLNVSVFSVLLMLIVNSIFEEIILIGYLFERLEKFHVSIIILFSLMIRVSFHTYQGVGELPRIVILGLVLGLYYAKYKKLLPVILAHGIGNIIYFLNYQFEWFDF